MSRQTIERAKHPTLGLGTVTYDNGPAFFVSDDGERLAPTADPEVPRRPLCPRPLPETKGEEAMKDDENARPWFYAYDREDEHWHGPHETRELALAEASPDAGQSVWLDQGDEVHEEIFGAACLDVDRIAEELADFVYDEMSSDAAELVTIREPEEAAKALRAWAERYVRFGPWWRMSGEPEEVKTHPAGPTTKGE